MEILSKLECVYFTAKSVRIVPGINILPDGAYPDIAMDAGVMGLRKTGKFVISEPVTENLKEGEPDIMAILSSKTKKEAIAFVEDILDRDLLVEIEEKSSRKAVVKQAKAQLAKLEEAGTK